MEAELFALVNIFRFARLKKLIICYIYLLISTKFTNILVETNFFPFQISYRPEQLIVGIYNIYIWFMIIELMKLYVPI